MRHCDDYIADVTAPEPLRAFLSHARAPAHGTHLPDPQPPLFARHGGQLVRVVMASRLGDVGIARDIKGDGGYTKRVLVSDLTDFSATPPQQT
jgi:hypothetical protein